jgi:hypothetical protein
VNYIAHLAFHTHRREEPTNRPAVCVHIDIRGCGEMLTIAEAQQRTELFLTGQMIEALQAVEYELPSFETETREVQLSDAARSRVQIRHVRGASDATYLVDSFGDELLMQLQLNVHRLVVVYRVPALDALDANTLAVRLERWRLGAEHAGWKFGWRDARSQAILPGAMWKPIATLSPAVIFSRTRRSNFIGAPTSCR